MVTLDFRPVFPHSCDLRLARRTVNHPEENFSNELLIVLFLRHQFGNGVLGIGDRICNIRTAQKSHHPTELNVISSITLTRTFSCWPAEGRQKPTLCILFRIDLFCLQLGRSTSHRVDRIVEDLRRETARFRVREVDIIVFVPLIDTQRQLISPGFTHLRDELADVKSLSHKALREVIKQLRIRGRITCSNIIKRLYHSGSKKIPPDTIGVTSREKLVISCSKPRR